MMIFPDAGILVDDADSLARLAKSHLIGDQSSLTFARRTGSLLSGRGKAQAPVPSIETVSPQLGPQENLIFGINSEAG